MASKILINWMFTRSNLAIHILVILNSIEIRVSMSQIILGGKKYNIFFSAISGENSRWRSMNSRMGVIPQLATRGWNLATLIINDALLN